MRHTSCLPLLTAALLSATPMAMAAPPSVEEMAAMVQKLSARVQQLEERNATLEAAHTRTEQALETTSLSENEPELTMRLKAVEAQAQSAQVAVRKLSALDGIKAGLNMSTVAQKPLQATGANSQLNYRADAFVQLPLSSIGAVDQQVYAQVRIGQGEGLNEQASFSKPNATAFRVLGGLRPDDSVAVLAQAWYQATIALPVGGHKPSSRESLEITAGKLDPFMFFDQNAAAGDETRQFINTIFVHNPLLDAGGDIGVDANGFAPGLRLSYSNVVDKPQTWRLSLGVFGAGERGATYQRSLSSPLVMVQAETAQRLFGGLAGNYRLYAWSNAQAAHFNTEQVERHSGWGISADQRVGDGITVFARAGQQLKGNVQFDRALTMGMELGGSYWDRAGDSIGLAAGVLATSSAYRLASAADGADASNSERIAELYYRWRLGRQLELSPHVQYIGRPAGLAGVPALKLFGLRAQLTY